MPSRDVNIVKTENGYHVEDTGDGELCFEKPETLLRWIIANSLPENVGDSIKIKDN